MLRLLICFYAEVVFVIQSSRKFFRIGAAKENVSIKFILEEMKGKSIHYFCGSPQETNVASIE